MADEQVATATPVETPVAPVTPVADTVISPKDLDSNKFTSDQLAEALENMKAGKVHKETPKVEPPVSESTQKEVLPETPKVDVSETVQDSTKTETPDFNTKVAEAVEAKIKEMGIVKPPVVEKPVEPEFHGYKTAEELQQAYEKDPVGTFNKVVSKQVKAEMEAFKAEVNESLKPVKSDLENRTVNTHLNEAKGVIKEMSDPAFMKSFEKAMRENPAVIDNAIKNGKNPYVEVGKLVRGEMAPVLEKQAYERGVKETEARLAKAGRAVVEGGGKVTVTTEGIDLDKASSSEIEAELKRHGRA